MASCLHQARLVPQLIQLGHRILPSSPFLGREDFQACRPPAGENRFDKIIRKSFLEHLGGQPLGIIRDGRELDPEVGQRFDQDLPDIGPGVVLRPAQDANLDKVQAP
jgi:hypothetical protein